MCRSRWTLSALVLGSFVSACALSDDYYLATASEHAGGGSGAAGAQTLAKSDAGGGAASDAAGAGGDGNGCTSCSDECTLAMFRGEQYAFCVDDETYARAAARCAEQGMLLARVNDDAQNAWIAQTMRGVYSGAQLRFFLGGTDAAKEGEWTWSDSVMFWRGGVEGEAVSGRYEKWASEQPGNYSSVTMTSEDCLTMTLSDESWNDMRCELPLPFVCGPR